MAWVSRGAAAAGGPRGVLGTPPRAQGSAWVSAWSPASASPLDRLQIWNKRGGSQVPQPQRLGVVDLGYVGVGISKSSPHDPNAQRGQRAISPTASFSRGGSKPRRVGTSHRPAWGRAGTGRVRGRPGLACPCPCHLSAAPRGTWHVAPGPRSQAGVLGGCGPPQGCRQALPVSAVRLRVG